MSRYADKVDRLNALPAGTQIGYGNPRLFPRRVCTKCGGRLAGRKNHGFPSVGAVYCGKCVKLVV